MRYQILSLTGGGFRGLFTATVLAELELKHGVSVSNRFELFAGTSVGALLAAGLALGHSASELTETMKQQGKAIFPDIPFKSGKQFLVKAPYTTEALATVARNILGSIADCPMREIEAPLLIVSVNTTQGVPAIHLTKGASKGQASDTTLLDAILASAAAPTFFPIHRVGTDDHIDGGVIANAPDLTALTHTMSQYRSDISQIYMLSVGTAGRRYGAKVDDQSAAPGIAEWLVKRRLVQTIMEAQQALSLRQVKDILGDRHLRIDAEPPEAHMSLLTSIDNAGPQAQDALESLAKEQVLKMGNQLDLCDFFE